MSYWADHPPVAELLAAFMGVKPKEAVEDAADIPLYPIPGGGMTSAPMPANDEDEGIAAMIRDFPNGFVRV